MILILCMLLPLSLSLSLRVLLADLYKKKMERWHVEAKKFLFTVVEGASVVRLEERRRNFSGRVLLGIQSLGWLISTVECLLWFPREKDFVRSFREGSKVLIVRRGGNAAGKYIEVAVYVAGGCKGIICIPEGRDGRGWRRFVMELEKVRGFFKALTGQGTACSTLFLEKPRFVGNGVNPGVSSDSYGKEGAPSYVEVLHKGLSCSEKESQPPPSSGSSEQGPLCTSEEREEMVSNGSFTGQGP
jgi:hypothetical protein